MFNSLCLMVENLRTGSLTKFAICRSIKRNLRTRISQKFADFCDCVSLRIFGFKKTVAWPPLQIYSWAWGKLIHEKKTWSQKSCGTIPLNLHVQNCTKWKPQIHAVIPCQLETNYIPWLNLLKGLPPPPHTQVT